MVPRYLYPTISTVIIAVSVAAYFLTGKSLAALVVGAMVQSVVTSMSVAVLIRSGYDTHGLLSEQNDLLINHLRAQGFSIVRSHNTGDPSDLRA